MEWRAFGPQANDVASFHALTDVAIEYRPFGPEATLGASILFLKSTNGDKLGRRLFVAQTKPDECDGHGDTDGQYEPEEHQLAQRTEFSFLAFEDQVDGEQNELVRLKQSEGKHRVPQ